jgi:hypothetical protein
MSGKLHYCAFDCIMQAGFALQYLSGKSNCREQRFVLIQGYFIRPPSFRPFCPCSPSKPYVA